MKTLMEVMREKNKTLNQVGDSIGISESYCSLLLNGKRRLSLDKAAQLSKVFGITIDEIFLHYDFAKRKLERGSSHEYIKGTKN